MVLMKGKVDENATGLQFFYIAGPRAIWVGVSYQFIVHAENASYRR
jgi:hypothetical protein